MKYIIGLFLAMIMVSCGSENKIIETDKNTIHSKWELNVLDGEQIKINKSIFIDLTEDDIVNGFIGCNRLTGSYSITNESQIKFNELATTRMVCPEMDMENKILELLNTADNFTIDSGKLMLNIGKRAPLAIFSKVYDNEIVNKYWKLKILDGKTIQFTDNQEKEQFFILKSDGSISGFAGCNHFHGQYELTNENNITFNKNMAVTLKACPDVDIDELAFLKVFELTDNYTLDGDTLSLNIGEKEALAVFEAVYF